MRHAFELAAVVVMLVAALVIAERNEVVAPVGAQSILYLVADSERDLTRMPSRFARIADADEAKYGDALAAQILAAREMADQDAAVEACVVATSARIAPHVHRRLNMRVHYLPDRGLFNAFAIPGGHVFIGAGLLEQMTTEDQLASVLSHEMEHVDHYHCAERLQVEAALRRIPLSFIVRIPVAVFQAGYSKEQELEADREGVLLAAAAGYSAAGAVDMFDTLARLEDQSDRAPRTPQEELAQVAVDALTGYFRSHPLTPERVAQVKAMIARRPALAVTPQRAIAVRHVFLTAQSLDAIANDHFDRAVELASRALAVHPDYAPALACLAEGEYGRGRMAAGRDAHRAAVASDPAAAAHIEKWMEARASALGNRKQYERELLLLTSDLLPRNPRVLRLLLLAYIGNGDLKAAGAIAEELRRFYPKDAEACAGEMQRLADASVASADFSGASTLATIVLLMRPGLSAGLRTWASAEFAQAHFAEAARALLDSYDPQTADDEWLRRAADATAATRSASAAGQFATVLSKRKPAIASDAAVRIELAGVALVMGDDSGAQRMKNWAGDGSLTPELVVRLGWWYLRAARVDDALALLRRAEALQASDAQIQNAIGWALLESSDPAAVKAPGETSAGSAADDARDVRIALAQWQLAHSRQAVDMWAAATEQRPQWRNPAWRGALYPPHTNALAEGAEAERRRGSGAARAAR